MGMLFAVPVGALIKVIFVRFVDKRLAEKQLEEEDNSSKNIENA